jgi:hypothetical protein
MTCELFALNVSSAVWEPLSLHRAQWCMTDAMEPLNCPSTFSYRLPALRLRLGRCSDHRKNSLGNLFDDGYQVSQVLPLIRKMKGHVRQDDGFQAGLSLTQGASWSPPPLDLVHVPL